MDFEFNVRWECLEDLEEGRIDRTDEVTWRVHVEATNIPAGWIAQDVFLIMNAELNPDTFDDIEKPAQFLPSEDTEERRFEKITREGQNPASRIGLQTSLGDVGSPDHDAENFEDAIADSAGFHTGEAMDRSFVYDIANKMEMGDKITKQFVLKTGRSLANTPNALNGAYILDCLLMYKPVRERLEDKFITVMPLMFNVEGE